MYITQRSISLLEALYANYTGKSFSETLAGIDAEIEAEKVNSILQLHKELGLSAEKISSLLSYDLAFVQNTIAENFKK